MMKYQILMALILFGVNSHLKAQIPFVEYQAVPNYQVNAQGAVVPIEIISPFSHTDNSNKQQKYSIIGGYTITPNGNLKRVKIQVNGVSNSFGGLIVYLRGTFNSTHSIWNTCNTQAVKVDEYIDGEYLSNNFEWKVDSYAYGTIYFNY